MINSATCSLLIINHLSFEECCRCSLAAAELYRFNPTPNAITSTSRLIVVPMFKKKPLAALIFKTTTQTIESKKHFGKHGEVLRCGEFIIFCVLCEGLPAAYHTDGPGVPDKPPCVLERLCELHDGLVVEAKGIKQHYFKPYIQKLFEKQVLNTSSVFQRTYIGQFCKHI